jgi:hypothetical protein
MGTLCGMGSLSAGHYSIILRSTNSSLLPFFSQQSILRAYGMRLIIIAADIGTFILAVNY